MAELPASWVQVFRRCERAVARAGLDVRVRLYPLEDLPESFQVLIVAPELRERAEAVARGAPVIAMTRENALVALTALLSEIERGKTLRAERVRPGAPRVVVVRGGEEV